MEDITQTKPKKRLSKAKKIIVIVLMLIVLFIVGFGVFTIIKMYGMSVNATKFVAKPTVSPYSTPDPGIELASDDPDISRDVDSSLDPNLIYADPIYVENAIDPDVVNILVLGEDAGDHGSGGGRSDVMLVVSYNQRVNTIKAVSVLRDTWIYIPGRDTWNRVNAAFRFGGVGLAINTINANFDLDIQYYMKTDFENMVKIVDKLGGLDLTLTQDEIDYYNTKSPNDPIKAGASGVCHLNGRQVLEHCRNRTLGNGDWSRTERQRAVMTALFARAKKERDVASLTSLIFSLTDYVETNLSPWQMISIGTGLVFGPNTAGPQKGTIPCSGSWSYAYEGSMAVIHMDLEANKQWLHMFFYGHY
ncbi:MAG: LCP family protein [Clostridia bacterium]|nr:LCP family protein [Clostridia bacterium]